MNQSRKGRRFEYCSYRFLPGEAVLPKVFCFCSPCYLVATPHLPLCGWEQGAHLVLVFGGLGKAVRMSSSRFEGGHV